MDSVILWKQPARNEWDVEFYESSTEAEAALAGFRKSYPWNTYYLLHVDRVVYKTAEQPGPKYTFIPSETRHLI